MSQYKAYPKYKDSGIEWIGQVPEHWQIAQLKRLVSIQNGSDHKAIETDDGYPVYGSGGQFAYASSYIYDGESVLLGRKGTIDRPMYVNEKFWTVDTMYWTKILPNTDGKFCYYAATTIPFSYYATNTALPSMTQSSLGAHLMAYPPLKEQAAISATLDRETARIDGLIEKKTRFIELLKEKRQALITHAVTKGLDPNVPMKDSGIEWIGQMPEHWGEERIFVNFLEVNVRGGEQSELLAVSQQYGVMPQKEYEELLGRRLSAQEKGDYSNYKRVVTGDLVYNKMRMWQGAIGIVPCEGIVSPAYVAFRPRDEFAAQYWHWLFKSNNFLVEVNRNSQGICDDQNSCNYDEFRTIRVPIPPAYEQTIIVNGVNAETLRIDALIEKTKQSITLLKERRAAFITAAVTGQIDLRGEH